MDVERGVEERHLVEARVVARVSRDDRTAVGVDRVEPVWRKVVGKRRLAQLGQDVGAKMVDDLEGVPLVDGKRSIELAEHGRATRRRGV